MSKKNSVTLNEQQIFEVKRLASETRQSFGVFPDVPIGSDIRLLLEKKGILLCEYPYPDEGGTHTYGNIIWFKNDEITFIGLNTSSYYDEQIFAIAHEIYHYTTQTGKAYTPELEQEDALTEKQADRFAAELLLPAEALKKAVADFYTVSDSWFYLNSDVYPVEVLSESAESKRKRMLAYAKALSDRQKRLMPGHSEQRLSVCDMYAVPDNRILRFIARVQCDWWLPYQAIVNRLFEEDIINGTQYSRLYKIDCRAEDGLYRRILRNIDSEIAALLNKKTKTVGVSGKVIETLIDNYEDGLIDEDEFIKTLSLFEKKPEDFGFKIEAETDDDLKDLCEGGDDE